ncbi:bifunctional diguanylate cyclase/phosphodiesterase [Candidatus Chloroploca asiatica]|uniref:Diguanylate cyclase n=1 Tax=Candidatus Chloroploca asiatica TaxID=1506545 RepID=A0A2H3L377_9CHLR|nr:EAL domain-containing protein [Candidatus Chloroploca asiatica]PDV96680.1 hypothetical protein A9Q02_20460 [Candidatus Chloroploca asiatica]
MRVRLNLTRKFIAILMVISVLPLMIVSVASYQVSRTVVNDEVSHYTTELLNSHRDHLDFSLEQLERLIINLSSVEPVLQALGQTEAEMDTYTRLSTQAQIGYILDSYTDLGGVVSIDIFTENGVHYHVGDTLNISNIRTDLRDDIIAQTRAVAPEVVWLGLMENVNRNSNTRHVVTLARALMTVDVGTAQARPVATLLVNYDPQMLQKHFNHVDLGTDGFMLVSDSRGQIIYHPQTDLIGAILHPDLLPLVQESQGSFTHTINDQPMVINAVQSQVTDWLIMSLVPVQTLDQGVQAIGTVTVLAMGLALLIVAVGALLVSRSVVNPIRQLTHRFQLYQSDRPGWSEPLKATSQDEIGELTRWFNAFLETLAARRHAEQALRESESRYVLALQGANDGIWDWDLRTQTIHYSLRWKMMLGYGDDAIGNSPDEWFKRIHPADYDHVRAQIDAHLRGELPHFESEYRMLCRDGVTYLWVLARGMAVADEHGTMVRMAGSQTDISIRKQTEEQVRYELLHDPLTGLPNRTYFVQAIEQMLGHLDLASGRQAAVLFLDLDRFKVINDSLGHAAGDEVLRMVAQRLSNSRRFSDVVARISGDEFALLLPEMRSFESATRVAERIQDTLSQPMVIESLEITIQASIGIAFMTGAYIRAEDLLRDADTALYQAKANGRACAMVFDNEMHTRSMDLLHLDTSLRRAIDEDELRVFYQPIADVQTGHVYGFEALVRWYSWERGMISPAEFVPFAEETGLITRIDLWVLGRALTQLQSWHRQGYNHLSVSVNLSVRSLQNPHLPRLVANLLTAMGLPPTSLHLEVTESAAMLDIEHTIALLKELRAIGVQLAIDDFGTGYSSLGYLRRLPVQILKIDRSFVRDITESKDAAAIASAVIAIGHILDMRIVAEGVETQAQRTFLMHQGCDAIQGYLISPPQPAELAEKLLGQTLFELKR